MNKCVELNGGRPFKGCIHIGAHLGEEAQAYASAGVRNVLWVEANPKLMKPLYDNTRDVSVKSKYFNAVITDVDNEEVELKIANNGQSSSIFEFGTHATMYPHVQYVDRIKMKSKRFDTLYKENIVDVDIDLYDFINLDIQGAELKALKSFGNLFENVNFKAIYTEINLEEVYKGCALLSEIEEFLDEKGFKKVAVSGESHAWGDCLFLKK